MKKSRHIDTCLSIANELRFKLLAIVGDNKEKKDNIIHYLKEDQFVVVNVGEELTPLYNEAFTSEEPVHDIGKRIKDWFLSKPDKIILTDASILYNDIFEVV